MVLLFFTDPRGTEGVRGRCPFCPPGLQLLVVCRELPGSHCAGKRAALLLWGPRALVSGRLGLEGSRCSERDGGQPPECSDLSFFLQEHLSQLSPEWLFPRVPWLWNMLMTLI